MMFGIAAIPIQAPDPIEAVKSTRATSNPAASPPGAGFVAFS